MVLVNLIYRVSSKALKPKASSKNFGVNVDNKLSLKQNIKQPRTKLEFHCGVASKLRHFIPKFSNFSDFS